MHARFFAAGLLAAVSGAGAALAANPTDNQFSGALSVKGTYVAEGSRAEKVKGSNASSQLETTPSDFQVTLAFSPVKGLFQKRKVLPPTDQNDLFNSVETLLAVDGLGHPVNLTAATMKGKGTFSKSGVKGKLALKVTYQGTTFGPDETTIGVRGKLKATFKGVQPL